jgi:virulence-associated protein VagC
MHAIEFEAIPRHHSIQIPEGVSLADGQSVRVLLLVNEEEAVRPLSNGSEEVFRLLTELSDDFMADGRQQPPLQARDDL